MTCGGGTDTLWGFMVAVNSLMVPLGTQAPAFELGDPLGEKKVSLEDFSGSKGYLVVFMCNHCPFVKHLLGHMPKTLEGYQKKGIAVVAINSNDVEHYPADAPQNMAALAGEQGFAFPYLFDADQSVAKAYGAMCTPDFFLFDAQRRLFYRGQYDSSRPGNGLPVTGEDLSHAVEWLLEGKALPQETQKASIGCNIKWKKGNEPVYWTAR